MHQMTKERVETPKQAPAPKANADPASRMAYWIAQRKRPVTIGLISVVFIGGAGWFMQAASSRREAFAANELQMARAAVEAENLQLAASDLGRIVSTYGSTRAGNDATVLLARVHLQQGQADLAVSELRTFLNGGPPRQFVAPAEALLAGALEQLGQFGDAASAFERAAAATDYDLVKAALLLDAGRTAALAGQLPRAISVYESVVSLVGEDDNAATEARFRMAELRRRSS